MRLVATIRGRDLADEMRAALAAHVERAVAEISPPGSDERPLEPGAAESPAGGERSREPV